jgi:hypothetical protein
MCHIVALSPVITHPDSLKDSVLSAFVHPHSTHAQAHSY